ncbi:MAG: hypothetical protein JWM16_3697 [Verrucomicrobiales bacterium]|nr:hypothetical protein [Verrucomicrobiales bacterium]
MSKIAIFFHVQLFRGDKDVTPRQEKGDGSFMRRHPSLIRRAGCNQQRISILSKSLLAGIGFLTIRGNDKIQV